MSIKGATQRLEEPKRSQKDGGSGGRLPTLAPLYSGFIMGNLFPYRKGNFSNQLISFGFASSFHIHLEDICQYLTCLLRGSKEWVAGRRTSGGVVGYTLNSYARRNFLLQNEWRGGQYVNATVFQQRTDEVEMPFRRGRYYTLLHVA